MYFISYTKAYPGIDIYNYLHIGLSLKYISNFMYHTCKYFYRIRVPREPLCPFLPWHTLIQNLKTFSFVSTKRHGSHTHLDNCIMNCIPLNLVIIAILLVVCSCNTNEASDDSEDIANLIRLNAMKQQEKRRGRSEGSHGQNRAMHEVDSFGATFPTKSPVLYIDGDGYLSYEVSGAKASSSNKSWVSSDTYNNSSSGGSDDPGAQSNTNGNPYHTHSGTTHSHDIIIKQHPDPNFECLTRWECTCSGSLDMFVGVTGGLNGGLNIREGTGTSLSHSHSATHAHSTPDSHSSDSDNHSTSRASGSIRRKLHSSSSFYDNGNYNHGSGHSGSAHSASSFSGQSGSIKNLWVGSSEHHKDADCECRCVEEATANPTSDPSNSPTAPSPTANTTQAPTKRPTATPDSSPTTQPSISNPEPSTSPTRAPNSTPEISPSSAPSSRSIPEPTIYPSVSTFPPNIPSASPTA